MTSKLTSSNRSDDDDDGQRLVKIILSFANELLPKALFSVDNNLNPDSLEMAPKWLQWFDWDFLVTTYIPWCFLHSL
jgi:hypothetical protein